LAAVAFSVVAQEKKAEAASRTDKIKENLLM
jgi:hypothetical protein